MELQEHGLREGWVDVWFRNFWVLGSSHMWHVQFKFHARKVLYVGYVTV
jgi:hypothetical protein